MSTESILIAPGFYLKVMGMDFEVPVMHKTNSNQVLRRTASVSKLCMCVCMCYAPQLRRTVLILRLSVMLNNDVTLLSLLGS